MSAVQVQGLPVPFPGGAPGPAPARGLCPVQPSGIPPAACRGMPPINPMLAALASGALKKKKGPMRLQLSWTAENRSPPRVGASAEGTGSVFEALAVEQQKELQRLLLSDNELEELFTRKKAAPPPKKKAVDTNAKQTSVRPSVLSGALTQKFSIIVRFLRKNYDEPDSWSAFKRALLVCQLDKQEINLLLETVPEPGSRKHGEWAEAVTAVRAIKSEGVELHEDEEFVYFMSCVPDLHQRLQCQLVMFDFDDLIAKVVREMEALADALEWMVRSPSLPRLFAAILAVGNFLNEGTAMGKKKWFRLASLDRVAELRAPGGGRSLLLWLAARMGPLCNSSELAMLQRAAQLTLVGPIQTACHLQDIYQMLANDVDGEDNGISAASIEGSDFEDKFIEVGQKFVSEHREHFRGLKADARRLVMDYQSAAEYFGDVEAVLPFDKKIEDKKNPGQTKFVPDLFQIFASFLGAYHNALCQVETERERQQKSVEAAAKLEARKRAACEKQQQKQQQTPRPHAAQSATPQHNIISVTPRQNTTPIPPPVHVQPPHATVVTALMAASVPSPPAQPPEPPAPPAPPIAPLAAYGAPAPAPSSASLAPSAASDIAQRRSSVRTSLRPSLFAGGNGGCGAVLHGNLEAVRELIEENSPPPPQPPSQPAASQLKRPVAHQQQSPQQQQQQPQQPRASSWLAAMRQQRKPSGVSAGLSGIPSFARPTTSSASSTTSTVATATDGNRRRESLRTLSGYLRASTGNPLATSAALPRHGTHGASNVTTGGLAPLKETAAEYSPDSAARLKRPAATAAAVADRSTLRSRLARLREADRSATTASRTLLLSSAASSSSSSASSTAAGASGPSSSTSSSNLAAAARARVLARKV